MTSKEPQPFTADPAQQKIIEALPSERLLVAAGPGTGKTQVCAMRLAHLVTHHVTASQILVLSFSRSAVRTLSRRVESLQSLSPDTLEQLRHLSVRTFDSWAFRILRLAGFPPGLLLSRTHDENIAELTALLQGPRREDLREIVGDRRHVIVDEFQDLPGVRGQLVIELLRLLAPPGAQGAGFTVLGDPAQAIFEFSAREANAGTTSAEYWDQLKALYAGELSEVALEENHRSTSDLAAFGSRLRAVLTSADAPATKLAAVRRLMAELPTEEEELGPVWIQKAVKGSHAILTRTNGEALAVARELAGKDNSGPGVAINLQVTGSTPGAPAWIAVLLGPLKARTLIRNQFTRIYAATIQKLDGAALEAIDLPEEETAWKRLLRASGVADTNTSLDVESLRTRMDWPDAFPDDQMSDGGILITTVHQAKGMEFDYVALFEREQAQQGTPQEEASVSFVGATRAGTRLARLPADCIYEPPPTNRDFAGERRTRRCRWWNGWVNLETGIPGDIDPGSFIDPALFGGDSEATAAQEWLAANASSLRGHKVMLAKFWDKEAEQALYNIHLQEGQVPGRLLGRTSQQLTLDLLELLWKRGYKLPGRIMNLRINNVTTANGSGSDADAVPPSHRISRMWLGVSLFGTGDFPTAKRQG